MASEGCAHAAMESTGVYWKPIYNILEGSMEAILAHARDVKNVPGRLRDVTRCREKLTQQRSSELNRLQKFLEDANIKLASVVSDINGASAQAMIKHLIQDDMSSQEMAQLAKGTLRSKAEALGKALEGCLTYRHRIILRLALQMIAFYDEAIAKLSVEIDNRMKPFKEESEKLQTIPGVKKDC